MGIALDDLVADIHILRREAANGDPYVPRKLLAQSCTRTKVLNALKECSIPQWRISSIARTVSDNGYAIFAILVWISKPEAILSFVDHHKLDSRLPFDKAELIAIEPTIPQFYDAQWAFVPVEIEKEGFRRLREKEVLPFQTEAPQPDLNGSSGAISFVTIDPSLHDLVPSEVISLIATGGR